MFPSYWFRHRVLRCFRRTLVTLRALMRFPTQSNRTDYDTFFGLHPIFMESNQMKTLISAIVIAASVSIPVVSFAQQTNGPLTRADVRAQLITAEQEGLIHQSNSQYPKTAPASEKAATAFDISGYGSAAGGSSQTTVNPMSAKHLLYSHH